MPKRSEPQPHTATNKWPLCVRLCGRLLCSTEALKYVSPFAFDWFVAIHVALPQALPLASFSAGIHSEATEFNTGVELQRSKLKLIPEGHVAVKMLKVMEIHI